MLIRAGMFQQSLGEDKNPGKAYHATVAPAQKFDALKDADTFYDANGERFYLEVIYRHY